MKLVSNAVVWLMVISLFPGCGSQPPREAAQKPDAAVPLEQTRWILVDLGGQPAVAGHEAYLELSSDTKRVAGSSGCNRVMGGYTMSGETLHFAQTAATRMACTDDLMKQEGAFIKALESTAGWRVSGGHLELTDSGGVMVARFEKK